MAVNAREVLLVFRAQNYMGNAIRRIGADVGGLSRAAQLSQARAGLTNTRQNLLNRRAAIETERQRLAALTKSQGATAALNNAHAVQVQRLNSVNRELDLNRQKLLTVAQAERQLKFQNFSDGARKVEAAGRAMQMFGLITGAAMGYAADKAAQFNTQATIAAAKVKQPGMTVGQIRQNAAQIQKGLTQQLLSGQSVVSPTDLTTGVYRTLSGLQLPGNRNQQIRESIQLVKQFQDVVKANYGMTNMDQVTQAAITTMRDFGFTTKNVSSALNTMQAAEKYGRMTMGEFLSTFNQAAPAAKAAGYSFKDMAGTIAFLSTKFPSVQTGATGYARLLQTLAQNATKFNQAGYQTTNKAGTQLLPLQDIITNFLRKTPQLAKGGVLLQNFFKQVTGQTGYIQARRVFTFLAQDLNGLDKVTKQVSGDNNVLAKSVRSAALSPGVKWQEFKNQLQGIVLVLGAGAIPAFKAFAKPIEDAIKWFERLNPHTQKFIGYMAAMIGIGAILGGTFLWMAGALARIGAIIGAGMFGRLAEEEGAIQIRSIAMMGAIGLLIFAFLRFHKQSMDVVNALGGVKDVFGLVFGAVAGIAVLRLVGFMGRLTKAVYAFRDAEIAADAVNPFFLLAAALGILTVYMIEHIHTLTRGWEHMVNIMYKFFVDYFINPVIKAINYFADAWNATLGHIFGGIGKLGQIADSGPFKIKWPTPPNKEAEAYKKAMQEGYVSGTYGMGMSTRKNPEGYLTKAQMVKMGWDPYSYGRGASTKSDPAGFLKLGSTADRAFRKTKAYLDQLNKATKDNKKFTDQAKQAAALYGTTATLSFQKAYKNYVDALAIAKKFPKNLQDQIKAQEALSALEAVATKQQIAGAKKAADATVAGNKQIASSTQETFSNVLSSVQSMYNNFLSTEQGIFGTLFQGPFSQSPAQQNYTQWGGLPTAKGLTKDLQSQLSQFRKFHNDLNNLQRRGAPSALIQQLMQLGPAALPEIKALMQMNAGQLRHYFKLFQEGQKMQQRQAMRDLRAQLNQYRKFGNQVALAIVAGIRDQNVAVTGALKKMIREMFPNLHGGGGGTTTPTHHHHHHHHVPQPTHHQRQHHVHHQHPHTRRTLSSVRPTRHEPQFVDYVRNTQYPLTRHASTSSFIDALDRRRGIFKQHFGRELKQAQPIKVWIAGWDKKGNMGGEVHHHDHYHVDTHKGSDVQTQIKHSQFKARNKNRGKKLSGDRYA